MTSQLPCPNPLEVLAGGKRSPAIGSYRRFPRLMTTVRKRELSTIVRQAALCPELALANPRVCCRHCCCCPKHSPSLRACPHCPPSRDARSSGVPRPWTSLCASSTRSSTQSKPHAFSLTIRLRRSSTSAGTSTKALASHVSKSSRVLVLAALPRASESIQTQYSTCFPVNTSRTLPTDSTTTRYRRFRNNGVTFSRRHGAASTSCTLGVPGAVLAAGPARQCYGTISKPGHPRRARGTP